MKLTITFPTIIDDAHGKTLFRVEMDITYDGPHATFTVAFVPPEGETFLKDSCDAWPPRKSWSLVEMLINDACAGSSRKAFHTIRIRSKWEKTYTLATEHEASGLFQASVQRSPR